MFYGNGCLFHPKNSLENNFLKLHLPKADILVNYKDLVTDKSHPVSVKDKITKYPGAAICTELGTGKIIIFGPHPEASGGFHGIIKNCLFWVTNKPSRKIII